MSRAIRQSPDTVRVIEHPIRGGWTLCLAGQPVTVASCFCWWAGDALPEAIAFAARHYAHVQLPPRPAPAVGVGAALRQLGAILLRP